MGHGTSEKIYDGKRNVRRGLKLMEEFSLNVVRDFGARKLETDFMSLTFDVVQLVGAYWGCNS
jgi:hypothetical protein